MTSINEELVDIWDSILTINQEIAFIQNTMRDILDELKKGQLQEPPPEPNHFNPKVIE